MTEELVSNIVRRWRAGAGLTQQELAHQVGVGKTHISGVENGRSTVSLQLLRRIGRETGRSLAELDLHATRTPTFIEKVQRMIELCPDAETLAGFERAVDALIEQWQE